MRKNLCVSFLFLLATALHAEDAASQALFSPGSKNVFKQESKTISQGVMQQEAQMEAKNLEKNSAAIASGGISDIMIVDPKIIAEDWVKAYEALRAKKLQNIAINIQGAPPITNISSIEPLPGGYLMLFTLKTIKGYKYEIVRTSSIISIETR